MRGVFIVLRINGGFIIGNVCSFVQPVISIISSQESIQLVRFIDSISVMVCILRVREAFVLLGVNVISVNVSLVEFLILWVKNDFECFFALFGMMAHYQGQFFLINKKFNIIPLNILLFSKTNSITFISYLKTHSRT